MAAAYNGSISSSISKLAAAWRISAEEAATIMARRGWRRQRHLPGGSSTLHVAYQ